MADTSGSPDPLEDLVAECLRRRNRDGAMPVDEVSARHPHLAAALRERLRHLRELGLDRSLAEPEATHAVTGGSMHQSLADRLRSLKERGTTVARYELRGEVARGGMGVILRAFDRDLGRSLAMKVILTRGETCRTADVDPQVLERFVEEAQITGQLDHPGVIPVHELGLDEQDRAYFTMRLVRGRTADEVFVLARERADGWTPTRAIEVLLKVCDTLAYAHSKSVVHRDLKPSNVMVGKYGEVYVMDWGLAKVLGRQDAHDLRIRPPESTTVSRVHTDRSKENESDPDSPLCTMDGAIVGTPCYMPPEQANGQTEEIGVRSDVYAAGAMLYSLLTGVQPDSRPGSKTSPYMVLERVREGPPAPVHKVDAKAPAELVAICERAMARSPGDRYGTMGELADELRAWLEGRVVKAYRTGARAELWSWVGRDRGMAAGLTAAVLALAGGGVAALAYARQADLARAFADQARTQAELERTEATTARAQAEEERKKALEALAAAQQAQKQQEKAETELRHKQIDLRDRASRAARSLEGAEHQVATLEADLRTERSKRVEQLRAAAEFARLEPLDTLLAARVTEKNSSGLENEFRELEGLLTRRAQGEGQAADSLLGLLHGTRWLIRNEPTDAVRGLGAALPDPVLEQARHRLLAVAHWQLGDRQAALRSQRASLRPADPECRNARELLGLLAEDLTTGDDADALATAEDASSLLQAADATQGVTLILRGQLHLASHATRVPELAGRAYRQMGRVDASLDVLRASTSSPTLQALLRLERARSHLAVHRPQLALAELGESATACIFLPLQQQHGELRAQAHSMAGNYAAALQAIEAVLALIPDGRRPRQLQSDRAALLRLTGRDAEADAVAAALPPAANAKVGPLAQLCNGLKCQVTTADARQTVRHLAEVAARFQGWLTEYSRFRATPWTPSQIDIVRRLATIAVDRLASAATADTPLDAAAAWIVLETFRDPLAVSFATRRGSLTSLGQPGVDYEQARAAWIENQLTGTSVLSMDDEQRFGAVARVETTELERFESKLRSIAPGQGALLLPRVPELMAVRARLPRGTCLVNFAAGGRRIVCLVVAREGCELVAIDRPAGLSTTSGEEARHAQARAIMDALLRSRLLTDVARWQRLLVAADGQLHELPLEQAAVASGAWPVTGEMIRVPAGSAWFDQLTGPTQWAGERTGPGGKHAHVVAEATAEPTANATRPTASAGPMAAAMLASAADDSQVAWWRDILAPTCPTEPVLILATASSTARDQVIAHATCLGLSLAMAPGANAGLGRLLFDDEQLVSAPDGLHLQSLRDLSMQAKLCIVRVQHGAAAVANEGASLASIVRGLWAAGCDTVITLRSEQALEPCRPIVRAVVAAIAKGQEPSRAWTAAMVAARERGATAAQLGGASLWSSR